MDSNGCFAGVTEASPHRQHETAGQFGEKRLSWTRALAGVSLCESCSHMTWRALVAIVIGHLPRVLVSREPGVM